MRTSQFPLSTLKETPADAELVSHRLMLRAGMIRRLAAGLYSWLPLGLRVLRKVENIVRQEMDRAGALEILMPAVQPAELWQESGRWEEYGPELLRITDRHHREFCFGPTHEEIITDLMRQEVRSYKQLPVTYYQIQTKFRDEIRPRFGLMRAREFLMKDAYSFHMDDASLQETYELMYRTYTRIFTRVGLKFRAVYADTGTIGGNLSHEFHVLAESGEDAIAFSTESDYAANVDLAEAPAPVGGRGEPGEDLQLVDTPDQRSIEEVAGFLKLARERCLKTLLVKGTEENIIALVLRGDHELNAVKAGKLGPVATPLTFAGAEEIRTVTGCEPGFIGPVGLKIPVIADHSAAALSDFVCGANQVGKHFTGANWERDTPDPQVADLRYVTAGEASPDGKGVLDIARGIEVGHIFQLGKKYSQRMQLDVLDEKGRSQAPTMGCYGIGVSRIVAAAIEQNHDDHGIYWPAGITPFHVALVPINMRKSARLREATDKLYGEFRNAGVEVLLDDRNARPGIMFADMELIGIPHRVVLSDRGLDAGTAEYRSRLEPENRNIPLREVVGFIQSCMAETD